MQASALIGALGTEPTRGAQVAGTDEPDAREDDVAVVCKSRDDRLESAVYRPYLSDRHHQVRKTRDVHAVETLREIVRGHNDNS